MHGHQRTNVNGNLPPVINFLTSTEISCINCFHRSGFVIEIQCVFWLYVLFRCNLRTKGLKAQYLNRRYCKVTLWYRGKNTVQPRRSHEGPQGELRYSTTLSLTSAKETRYPFRGGWEDWCGKSRPLPGSDPRTVQPVASRYTD